MLTVSQPSPPFIGPLVVGSALKVCYPKVWPSSHQAFEASGPRYKLQSPSFIPGDIEWRDLSMAISSCGFHRKSLSTKAPEIKVHRSLKPCISSEVGSHLQEAHATQATHCPFGDQDPSSDWWSGDICLPCRKCQWSHPDQGPNHSTSKIVLLQSTCPVPGQKAQLVPGRATAEGLLPYY